jgi:hypothetical protein|nr:MAG TPA: hypothetical protein [Bacteriophage sp.]
MVIEGSFYRLTPISDSSPFFDLELLYDIGGKNPRKEFKIEGYGYPLEVAIDRCCRYAASKKFNKEEIVTLKQYLDEFKKAKEEIRLQIYGSTKSDI